MEKVSKYSLVLLTILLVALLMHASISELKLLVAVQSDEELKASKSFQYQYPLFHVLAFLHIPVGLIFLVTGGYQFIPVFRKRYHQTHKTVGRIFLVSSLIVSSTAITMGIFYPYGNYLESLNLSSFWHLSAWRHLLGLSPCEKAEFRPASKVGNQGLLYFPFGGQHTDYRLDGHNHDRQKPAGGAGSIFCYGISASLFGRGSLDQISGEGLENSTGIKTCLHT
ncbi:DUF2306 domain-containing protein [Litoribacter ruber]|uniref:DUF2306 domain-containing protein n=1 Tax=Litoribacter ruber TaxID=702568 RepID=UPI001BD93719|nr:DUF2306 domain-containing protein [Litoribacter ruber]MBT0811588.1 DUF2306 domain-containing protein [Litoribacter ruber]